MKKIIIFILSVLIALSLLSCGGDAPEAPTETPVETPVATPETAEQKDETPLPEWFEKREDGFYQLLIDKIEGFHHTYSGDTEIKFSSLAEMQDVLLYSLPTYENKQDFLALQHGGYKLCYDPRALLEPVFPSDLTYKIFNVYMDMDYYYVGYSSEDKTFAGSVSFAIPTSPGYYYGWVEDTNEPPSSSYDNYYEDRFLSPYYMNGKTPTGNTVELENGVIAEEYMDKDGTTELLYMVKDGYYVHEMGNKIRVLIEMDGFCVNYCISKIPENWTREMTWSLSAKPLAGN